MPKQRASFIIATYEGLKVDWGYIVGVALREQSFVWGVAGKTNEGDLCKVVDSMMSHTSI